MAEKEDYLQIGGSNINNKSKELCLVAGVLTMEVGVKFFVHRMEM